MTPYDIASGRVKLEEESNSEEVLKGLVEAQQYADSINHPLTTKLLDQIDKSFITYVSLAHTAALNNNKDLAHINNIRAAQVNHIKQYIKGK